VEWGEERADRLGKGGRRRLQAPSLLHRLASWAFVRDQGGEPVLDACDNLRRLNVQPMHTGVNVSY
jgi:hypothetical protein